MRVQHVHVHVLSRRCVSLADPKILHSLSRVPQSHAQPRPGWRPARDPISPGASGLRLRGSDRSSFVVGLRTAQPAAIHTTCYVSESLASAWSMYEGSVGRPS